MKKETPFNNSEIADGVVLRPAKPLKEFSKENFDEERGSLAGEIRAARKDRHSKLSEARKDSASNEALLEKTAEKLRGLAKEIEEISTNNFSKLVNFIRLNRLNRQLREANDLNTKTEAKKRIADRTIDDMSLSGGRLPTEFLDSKRKIEDFYRRQMEAWKESKYDKSEIERYFNKDYLSSLSLEDYQILLARFASNMVTHVTRQGIRDHFGMSEHSFGLGKMWNGFKDLARDKRFKHAIELKITNDDNEAKIAEYFGLEHIQSREEALMKLGRFTDLYSQYRSESFVDFHSIHFAVRRVSNEFYGAESGNEIFIAYPSYMMAANYFHRRDPHVPMDATNYNDLWVYIDENEELPLDAGVVFIPKDADVHPDTGSKYEMDENNEPLPDNEKLNRIMEILSAQGFDQFCVDAYKKLGSMHFGFAEYLKGNSYNGAHKHDREFKIVDEVLKNLKRVCPDITDEETRVVMDYEFLFAISCVKPESVRNQYPKIIKNRLMDLGIYYKKTSNTVSSKEYWEGYFAKNPNQRPSKVVYYEGGNPNEALYAWQRQTGQSYDKDHISFPENLLQLSGNEDSLPDNITTEMNRFKSIAERVINNFYDNKK